MELLQGLFPVRINVGEQDFLSNIQSSIRRDLPWLQQSEVNDKYAVIVGGGPSLGDFERELKQHQSFGHVIFALNNTANWLIERDIKPDYHVLLDARESVSRFVTDSNHHLIASQCHPFVFDKAKNITLWHPNIEEIIKLIGDRQAALIGGGTTVGLQAMSIAYTMGFRRIHLYGMDSSYRDDKNHAYPQPENDNEEIIRVDFAGRTFHCSPWMIRQTEEFKSVLRQLVEDDCLISVSGDGFLPETFKEMLRTTLTAVYDLAVSPPTYDFISFLGEAEKARINQGHTYLDIVFMPGPNKGFRDDNLPPSSEIREGMLNRICVPACRLLPSVRNVTILKERKEIQGNIFPENWTVLTPVSHYGTTYMKTSIPCLHASEVAKNKIKELNQFPYVTITLRESNYWPERNSNISEWQKAAVILRKMGYMVVFVDDVEKTDSVYSWDIDLRLALYEKAVCNLMVSNGPLALCVYSNVPYLAFRILTPSCPSTTKEFLERNGVNTGDNYSSNGRLVWEDDTAEVIIREFTKFIQQEKSA